MPKKIDAIDIARASDRQT